MGRIGRWIDSLPAEGVERDAIITHPDPTYHGRLWWSALRDCGCLVGCVIGKEASGQLVMTRTLNSVPVVIRRTPAEDVGMRFPDFCDRFGAERMWRLVKARAAKNHRLPLPSASGSPERVRQGSAANG